MKGRVRKKLREWSRWRGNRETYAEARRSYKKLYEKKKLKENCCNSI